MGIPHKMKALVVSNDKSLCIKSVLVPEPISRDYILIKVKAVAANPVDCKFLDAGFGSPGSIVGCDAAGIIVQLSDGEEDSEAISMKYGYKIGDFVTGIVHGMSAAHPENGAFANYCWLEAGTSSKFTPASHDGFASGKQLGDYIEANEKIDSFEKAASLPVSLYTATMVLVKNLNKSLDFDRTEWQDSKTILLVYGGGTAFAQNFLQINKLAKAFKNVVTIASKKHDDILKLYGVIENFDYNSDNFIDTIVKKYPNIHNIVDAVSKNTTFANSYAIAKKVATGNEKVNLVNLMGLSSKNIEPNHRDDSKVEISSTNLFLADGIPISSGPLNLDVDQNYRNLALKTIPMLSRVICNGELKTIPISINKKMGLEGAIDAVDSIRRGKSHGEKFLVRF